MAIFVPDKWTQVTFVIFWFVWFAVYLVWLFAQYFVFKPRTPLVLTTTFFLTLFAMLPASESLYAYFPDADPYNTAPYIQWYCLELRFMALVVFSLYLLTVVGRNKWPSGSGTRTAITWLAIVPFVLFFVLGGIVVGDKANPFTGKKPYEAFTYILDWFWVLVSLISTMIASRLLLWHQIGGGSRDENVPRGSKLHAYAAVFFNGWIFIGTLVYAISIVTNRDDYDGSVQYYFQQKNWIEQWAPYFNFIFVIISYSCMIGYMFMLMRAYNRETYGTKYPEAWPETTTTNSGSTNGRSKMNY